MKTVVLYSDGGQECDRVKQLLISLGEEFLEYRLGKHFTQSEFRREFGESAEYPQVAIDLHHIGGLKDTLHYLQDQGLI